MLVSPFLLVLINISVINGIDLDEAFTQNERVSSFLYK